MSSQEFPPRLFLAVGLFSLRPGSTEYLSNAEHMAILDAAAELVERKDREISALEQKLRDAAEALHERERE